MTASAIALCLLPMGAITVAQSDGSADASATLEGSEWQLSRMAARGPWDMTIGFGPDGALTATTPCFDVAGRYETQGEGIEIEAAKVADSGGDDPACDIVQQAGGDLLLQALADAERWTIDATGVLTVFPASGAADYELTLEPMAEPQPAQVSQPGSLAGSWQLVDIIDQTGAPAPLPDDLVITLEIDDMGAVSGTAGCSAYEASYAVDESAAMSIIDLTAEEVGDCDPMIARMQQDYLRLVESVDESSREGDRLVLGTDPWGFDLYFEAAD